MNIRLRSRPRRWLVLVGLVSALGTFAVPHPAGALDQNDAGSGADAGNTFTAATPLSPRGRFEGRLDGAAGDAHDWYRFPVRQGTALSVLVSVTRSTIDPVTLVDPNGVPVDGGVRVASLGVAASPFLTTEPLQIRLAIHRAAVGGDYRLHLSAEQFPLQAYELCFMNCEGPQDAPIDLIFGGSLPTTETKVLLVPPTHGDLGNPLGPSVLDYLNATLRGMHTWTRAMDDFATEFPAYGYLRRITVEVEIFDGVTPADPAGYDVVIGYVAAGPVFRGIASDVDQGDSVQQVLRSAGIDQARFTGRAIALSLFGSSPRAGQVLYDFPEVVDLEMVTVHEFGHTFGLGHTTTWHPTLSFDVMNSPAPFVYGDAFPLGDGGERTAMTCLSSLDLYGMAHLYRWVPDGTWEPSSGSVRRPPGMPYKRYC